MHFMQFFLEIVMKIEALSFKNIGPEGNLIEKEKPNSFLAKLLQLNLRLCCVCESRFFKQQRCIGFLSRLYKSLYVRISLRSWLSLW